MDDGGRVVEPLAQCESRRHRTIRIRVVPAASPCAALVLIRVCAIVDRARIAALGWPTQRPALHLGTHALRCQVRTLFYQVWDADDFAGQKPGRDAAVVLKLPRLAYLVRAALNAMMEPATDR